MRRTFIAPASVGQTPFQRCATSLNGRLTASVQGHPVSIQTVSEA